MERLMTERLQVYADLLRVAAKLADNAMTWSVIPLADLKENDSDELDRLIPRVRIVASENVYGSFRVMTRATHRFNRLFVEAKSHQVAIQRQNQADDVNGLQQRMQLGEVADELRSAYTKLESAIRHDMLP